MSAGESDLSESEKEHVENGGAYPAGTQNCYDILIYKREYCFANWAQALGSSGIAASVTARKDRLALTCVARHVGAHYRH
jgi:hypothetical protein